MTVSLAILAVCTLYQTYIMWRRYKYPHKKNCAIDGVCCACLYQGEDETPCYAREDRTHCVHWWEGP